MIRTLVLLVIAIAVTALTYAVLPPRATVLRPPAALGAPVRGVIHVHSRRSDGSGTADDIAAAAGRAGLKFVVFTDHGDATREPDPPVYRHGVLCIDAAEVSTDDGHVVVLGLPKSPYPLGGEGRDVIEDVARMGGFAIAAHPGSPKPGLRWTEWTAPFGGLEWLNGDSEWRDETPREIARALFTYPMRGAESVARLLDRPDDVLRRWDVLTQRRPVVAVAASDAHARLGTRGPGDTADGGLAVRIPSYEQVFRAFSIALPQARFTGDARSDAGVLLDEIRRGHVYSSIEALAAPGVLSFTGSSGSARAVAGDTLVPSTSVMLRVQTDAPAGARIDLLKNGVIARSGDGPVLDYAAGTEPAVYRVEVRLPHEDGHRPVPWLLSNPIYVRSGDAPPPLPQRPPPSQAIPQYDNGPATGWRVEHSPRSAAAFDVVRAVGGTQILFRYALGGTMAESPYAALVMPAGPAIGTSDRVMFTASADRPTRVSIQIRVPHGSVGERWHRSVYLDTNPRTITVFFDDMRPTGVTTTVRPTLERVESVLWVLDGVNTKPGTNGQIWIDDVKYGR